MTSTKLILVLLVQNATCHARVKCFLGIFLISVGQRAEVGDALGRHVGVLKVSLLELVALPRIRHTLLRLGKGSMLLLTHGGFVNVRRIVH